ncbi:CheY-like chemotaxis protein [Oxalobacteraceae bacterium GrIS 1.11]
MSILNTHQADLALAPADTSERRQASDLPGADGVERACLNLLVVDDNLDAAETLAMALEMLGHKATVARNGQIALAQVSLRAPDAIFLDIEMPGLGGVEMAGRLRANPKTAAIPLVAVTGHGLPMYMESALSAGFRHFLLKPVHMSDLQTTLLAVGA